MEWYNWGNQLDVLRFILEIIVVLSWVLQVRSSTTLHPPRHPPELTVDSARRAVPGRLPHPRLHRLQEGAPGDGIARGLQQVPARATPPPHREQDSRENLLTVALEWCWCGAVGGGVERQRVDGCRFLACVGVDVDGATWCEQCVDGVGADGGRDGRFTQQESYSVLRTIQLFLFIIVFGSIPRPAPSPALPHLSTLPTASLPSLPPPSFARASVWKSSRSEG